MGKKKGSKKKGSKKKSGKKSAKGEKSKVLTAEEKLWAKRYNISEASRSQHRTNASTLVTENGRLQTDLQAAERDAIEVISHFTQQIAKKEQDNGALNDTLKQLRRQGQEDKATLKKMYENEIISLKDRAEAGDRLNGKLQSELESLHEWNEKRQELRAELDLLKMDNEAAKVEYEKYIVMKQDKFLEEKIRLRKETDAEISQLASTAHAAAVAGLDETTRKTYKENVRLAEELSITKGENERLNIEYAKTHERATLLESQKTEAEMLAKQSVIKTKRHQQDMVALKDKVDKLETALSHCIREFERERALIIARTEEATEGTIADLSAAQRALKLKAAENKRIRHLAKYIVEQRSEMEVFFQESLMTVKTEISRSRAMYEKEIKEAHNKQMLEGHRTGVLPPIMTFGAASKSTNSVHADYEAAAKMPNLDEEVDIRDLTWEQKEIVLRRLFAKMNVAKKAPPAAPPVSPGNFSIMASSLKTAPSTAPIPEDADEDDGSTNSFFLTTMEPEAAAGEVSS